MLTGRGAEGNEHGQVKMVKSKMVKSKMVKSKMVKSMRSSILHLPYEFLRSAIVSHG